MVKVGSVGFILAAKDTLPHLVKKAGRVLSPWDVKREALREKMAKRIMREKMKSSVPSLQKMAFTSMAAEMGKQASIDLYVDKSEDMDRGMFAERDFEEGEVIEVAPVLVVPRKQIKPTDVLRNYVFRWDDDHVMVALGYASMFNHSYKPNARYDKDKPTRTLTFKAIKPIKKGEEIFVNYNHEPDNKSPLWFDVKEKQTEKTADWQETAKQWAPTVGGAVAGGLAGHYIGRPKEATIAASPANTGIGERTERVFYHGTRPGLYDRILSKGLDPSMMGTGYEGSPDNREEQASSLTTNPEHAQAYVNLGAMDEAKGVIPSIKAGLGIGVPKPLVVRLPADFPLRQAVAAHGHGGFDEWHSPKKISPEYIKTAAAMQDELAKIASLGAALRGVGKVLTAPIKGTKPWVIGRTKPISRASRVSSRSLPATATRRASGGAWDVSRMAAQMGV